MNSAVRHDMSVANNSISHYKPRRGEMANANLIFFLIALYILMATDLCVRNFISFQNTLYFLIHLPKDCFLKNWFYFRTGIVNMVDSIRYKKSG